MSHLQDAAIQAAETIQSAHINHRPSIEQDLAPETAADTKRAVRIDDSVDLDALSDIDEDEIPVSILKPPPRGPQMPPLPDLRFEQSYLASIKDAKDWQTVGWITLRDHVRVWLYTAKRLHMTDLVPIGADVSLSRCSLDAHPRRMETLEWRGIF